MPRHQPVHVRDLREQLQPEGPRPGDGLERVVGVDHRRAVRLAEVPASVQGVADVTRDPVQGGAVLLDPRQLRRCRGSRHEHVGPQARAGGGPGHSGTVVAAGRSGHGLRAVGQREHVVHRAARLERAGVLQQLQLQHDPSGHPDLLAGERDDRGTTYRSADARCHILDVRASREHHAHAVDSVLSAVARRALMPAAAPPATAIVVAAPSARFRAR